MKNTENIESTYLFQSPKFIDGDYPKEVRVLPILSYILEITRPHLIVDLELETGNFYFTFCQAIESLKNQSKCIGFLTPKVYPLGEGLKTKKLITIKQHNIELYNEFSSILLSPPEQGLKFIENNSVDILNISCESVDHYFKDWEKKLSHNSIVFLNGISENPSSWKKLKEKYQTLEFGENALTDLGVIFYGKTDQVSGSRNMNFLSSKFSHQLFINIGNSFLEKNLIQNSTVTKIRNRKLKGVKTQLGKLFEDHLNSWRWKLGNNLVRLIEKTLFRKKPILASDKISQLLKELSSYSLQDNNLNFNKDALESFVRKYILCESISNITIGFAVTSAHPTTKAGDFFTALELAIACKEEFGWASEFLSQEKDWYSAQDIDVLVTMKHSYDLDKLNNNKRHLIRIAWVRNRLDEWLYTDYLKLYDLVLCSSKPIYKELEKREIKNIVLFPIATNPKRFLNGKFNQDLSSDYCFTGNYWGAPRGIEGSLDPSKIDGKFLLFGQGWNNHDILREYWQGPIPYEKMPDIYASTKIVIDDATIFTENWASVNSRVFDALCSGKLVLTNGKKGVAQLFSNQFPTYTTESELSQKLNFYLKNNHQREELAKTLQKEVLEKHTYQIRARQLKKSIISKLGGDKIRVSIKVPIPNYLEAENWGDYHFAIGLKKALKKYELSVRIDCIPDWYKKSNIDDIVIVLKGLSSYTPNPSHINLLWVISHPEKVSISELDQYHHIFIASYFFAKKIASKTTVPVSPLLQCTDPEVFKPDFTPSSSIPRHEYLFVGNSRSKLRKIIQDIIAIDLPVAVYGKDWENLIPNKFIKGDYIPNEFLFKFYSRGKFILNDHWDSMRSNGFISNRIFDAGACGKCIITDEVVGLSEVFPKQALLTYNSPEELRDKLMWLQENPSIVNEMGELLRRTILENHTFDHRAKTIIHQLRALKICLETSKSSINE